jgi:predicted PurR-regulated permease PerM
MPEERKRWESETHVVSMARWLLILVFVVIGYWILSGMAHVLAPVLAAGGIAYLLDSTVDRLEAKGMPRVWAVTLLLVLFLGVTTGLIIVLAPLVVEDVGEFINGLPGMVDRAVFWAGDTFGFEVPEEWEEYLKGDDVGELLKSQAGPLTDMATAVLGGFFSTLSFLAEMLLVPVFAFYFLLDWDHMVDRVRRMIPPRRRTEVVGLVKEIDMVVSVWIRGQLMVVSILAILYAIAFYFCDVHLAIPIGLLVGFLTIIPFLGTFVGAAITMVLIFLDWQGWWQVGAVGGVFVVLHLLEAAVLTPKIVGKKVGLGEAGALFAVLAGGKLLGFTGVLLAVPIAASIAVLLRHAVGYYERSDFFALDEDMQIEGSLVPARHHDWDHDGEPDDAGEILSQEAESESQEEDEEESPDEEDDE